MRPFWTGVRAVGRQIAAGVRVAVVYVLELLLVVRCATYELVAALEPESGVKVFSVFQSAGRTWFDGERAQWQRQRGDQADIVSRGAVRRKGRGCEGGGGGGEVGGVAGRRMAQMKLLRRVRSLCGIVVQHNVGSMEVQVSVLRTGC